MGVNSHFNAPITVYARGAGITRFSSYEGTWYSGTRLMDNTHIYRVMIESIGLIDENRNYSAKLSDTVLALPETSLQGLNPLLIELQLSQAVADNGPKTVYKPGIGSGMTPGRISVITNGHRPGHQ